jgi:hypothetical protein
MKAYRQEDVSAEYLLSQLHKKGTPFSCHPESVKTLPLPLAQQGYPPAMKGICAGHIMENCYLLQDIQLAIECCGKAAQLGVTPLPSAALYFSIVLIEEYGL